MCFCCFVVLWFVLFCFSKIKKLVKNTSQESAPRKCGGGWQSTCNSCLLWWFWTSPLTLWKPKKMIERLKEIWPDSDNARVKLATLCLGMAFAYQIVANCVWNPQGEKKITGTMAKSESQTSMVFVAPVIRKKHFHVFLFFRKWHLI